MKLFGYEIRKVTNSTRKIPDSFGASSPSTFYYSPRMSVSELMANSTVNACVNIIADAVAVLSCNVYKKTKSGREKDESLNLAKLLRRDPNFYDTAFTFKQKIMLHLLLKGNAFIFIERNLDFSIRALSALDPEKVAIKQDDQGDVYYIYTVNGRDYKYNTDMILHIPAIRYNSLRGLSPLEYSSMSAKTGIALDEYTSNFFDGGIHSKLLVEVPQDYQHWTKEDSRQLSDMLVSAYGGANNANKPLIFSRGMKATPINLSNNNDSQLVQNRSYSEKEIAKIYRVPLFMLGSEASKFTNMEQANTNFLQHTLTPWLVRIQEYLDRLLIGEQKDLYYVEFDTNTMLRADYASRMDGYVKGLTNGIFTLNDVLKFENMPAVNEDYADKHFIQVNLSPMDKIATAQKSEEQQTISEETEK